MAEQRALSGTSAALAVLALLCTCAVFAPLLANDRPLYIKAVDHGAVDRAHKSLEQVVLELARLQAAGAPPAALEAEGSAVLLRTATLKAYLASAASRARVRELERAVEALLSAARSGRSSEAAEAAARMEAQGLGVRVTLAAPAGAELRARSSFPALAGLAPLDGALMGLWLGLALAFACRRRVVVRRLVPVGCAVVGAFVVALGASPGPVDWKGKLTRGEIEAERVVFAPLAYGYAESNMSECLRPPTWRSESEMDDTGRYVKRANPAAAPTPVEVRYGEPARNAALRHPLGTDALGRDLLTRILWGGRISLAVGLFSAALIVTLGVLFGALAGYGGAAADFAITRAIEVLQSIPTFFLVLSAVALVPESIVHPMIAIVCMIALVGWTGVARLVRGEVLRIREEEYVLAARALGFSPARVLWRHVLPGALGPVLVAGAFAVASGVLIESAVSFLGFGVRLPFPSWGALLHEPGRWWIQLFPGALIFVTVACTNVVGEGVRDALEPRRVA